MMGPDLDVLKDVPGYQTILKAVLKTQIQLLVEQLSNETGEESVLLTASITEGTLSHLGSESGKVFLEGHEDIKSQFLGFCLKRHHKRKSQVSPPDVQSRRERKGHGEKRPRLHPAFPTNVPTAVSTQNQEPVPFGVPRMVNREAAAFNIPVKNTSPRVAIHQGPQLIPNSSPLHLPNQVPQLLPHSNQQGQKLLPHSNQQGQQLLSHSNQQGQQLLSHSNQQGKQILPHSNQQGPQPLPEPTPVGAPFQIQPVNQGGQNSAATKSTKPKSCLPSQELPIVNDFSQHTIEVETNTNAGINAEHVGSSKANVDACGDAENEIRPQDSEAANQNTPALAAESPGDNNAADNTEASEPQVKVIKLEVDEEADLEITGVEMADASQSGFAENEWTTGLLGEQGYSQQTKGSLEAAGIQDFMRNWPLANNHIPQGIPTSEPNAMGHEETQPSLDMTANGVHASGDIGDSIRRTRDIGDSIRRRGSVKKRKHRFGAFEKLPVVPDSLMSLGSTNANALPVLPPPQQFAELTHFPKLAPNTPNYPLCSGSVGVHLINQDLWRLFYSSQTEMILTKSGRRMFPVLEFHPFGLDPDKLYNVYMDMPAVSKYTWKFQDCAWVATGESKSDKGNVLENVCVHPDSQNTGQFWMKHGIMFDKLKLTNNTQSSRLHDQIYLVSMHLYQPRLNIMEVNNNNPNHHLAFAFPETQFIAITAYNNTLMTQLKIEHNKFAKGFRDTIGTDLPMGFRTIERMRTADHKTSHVTEKTMSDRRHSLPAVRRHSERRHPDRRYAEFRDASFLASTNPSFPRGQVNPDAVQTPEMKKIIELIQQREKEEEQLLAQSKPFLFPSTLPTATSTAADTHISTHNSDVPVNLSPEPSDLNTIPHVPPSEEVIDVDLASDSSSTHNDGDPSDSTSVPLYKRLYMETRDTSIDNVDHVDSHEDENKGVNETDKDNTNTDVHDDGVANTSETETVSTSDNAAVNDHDEEDDGDEPQTIIIRDNAAGQWVVKMEQD